MKGARPLDNHEIRAVRGAFDGKYADRNRGLFMLGVSIGGRISELLSLCVGDVWQNDAPVTDLMFDKDIVKGKELSRTVPVNTDGAKAIRDLISWHIQLYRDEGIGDVAERRHEGGLKYDGTPAGDRIHYQIDPDTPLFPSQKADKWGNVVSINRQSADRALKAAFTKAGLNGKLATHSMRKSFAQRLYHQTHDMRAVQEMLGHKNITTTEKYVGADYSSIKEAVEAMSLHAEDIGLTDMPTIDKATNAELVEELLKRNYDFAQLTGDNQ